MICSTRKLGKTLIGQVLVDCKFQLEEELLVYDKEKTVPPFDYLLVIWRGYPEETNLPLQMSYQTSPVDNCRLGREGG